MTGAGDRVLGSAGREHSEAGAPLLPRAVFGALALCVLPLFAHGCHRGDHDDEPSVLPAEQKQRGEPGASATEKTHISR